MENDPHPTGFTYNLDVVPDYPGYEWRPEPDENGRTIYKPHKMETTSPEIHEIKQLNAEVDTLLEMASQRVFYADLEDNLTLHHKIGSALNKWRSEGIVRIHPEEVQALVVYQNQLLAKIDEQRVAALNRIIADDFEVDLIPVDVRHQEDQVRMQMGLPPISFEGFKK